MPKIAIIGAGSVSFSASLIRDLTLAKDLYGSTVTFMDINEKRLDMVYDLASRYMKEVSASLKLEKTTDREKAIDGADFVINTVKVGGYGFMEAERDIAEKHGYYRGLGDKVSDYYGGFAAFKQLNFILELAKDVERVNPNAYFLQVSNPVFEGTNLVVRETKLKAVGFCHGAEEFKIVTKVMGLKEEDVEFQVAGFNHCIWLTKFLYQGKDGYPLLDEWIEKESVKYFQSEEYLNNPWGYQLCPAVIEMYRLYGLFPIGDTVRSVSPWWFNTDLETKKKWFSAGGPDSEIGWTMYLFGLKLRLRSMMMAYENKEISLAREFSMLPSSESIVPFIDSVVNDKKLRLILNVPNNGAIEGIPDDVVVEIPVIVGKNSIEREKIEKIPGRLMVHIIAPRWWRMENILQAFKDRDKMSLLLMIAEDHRTKSFEQAEKLLEELLSQEWNKDLREHYR